MKSSYMFLSDFSRGKVIGSTGRGDWFDLTPDEQKNCLAVNKISSFVKMSKEILEKCGTVFGSDLNVNPLYVIDTGDVKVLCVLQLNI